MKVLFDTSVLVAALVRSHPMHERAFPWLRRAAAGDIAMLTAAHSLIELYAVLTRYPSNPRIAPPDAARLIQESVVRHATVVPLSEADHTTIIQALAKRGLSGGLVYDALHVRAAKAGRAQKILSFNARDFERLSFLADCDLTVP